MRDKKIISFKEFYLREDHHTGYFPTFKAGYEGIKKHGPGIVKGGAKLGAKGIAGAAKGIAGGTKGLAKGAVGAARGTKRGFDKIARGLTNFGKSMAPEYKNQFSARDKPAGNTLADSKTTQEAATTIAKWRDKNITKKDGTPAEAKTLKDFMMSGALNVPADVFKSQNTTGLIQAFEDDYKKRGGKIEAGVKPPYLKYFKMSPGTGMPVNLKLGQVLPLMVLMDGGNVTGIVDGKYTKEGQAWPKVFARPGHYANQFVDSMKRYFDTGYNADRSVQMAQKNFNQDGINILRKNRYLPWESL